MISVGDDKLLHIRDAKNCKEVKALPAHDGAIVGIAVSADGAKAVTVGLDKTAKIWNLNDGKTIAGIVLAGIPQSVALSPNGVRLAVAYAGPSNRICTYDGATGNELQCLADGQPHVRSLYFLANNRTVVAATDDKTVSLYDAAVQSALPVHSGGATAIIYHSNGTQVFTAGKDKLVRYWDAATGKDVKSFGALADPVNALAVSRDFNAVGAAAGRVVKVWQVNDGKEIAALQHPAEVISLAFNPDRTRIMTGATDNVARVWDLAGGRLLQSFSQGGAVRGAAFHPNQPLVLTASADKTVAVHGLTINKMIAASNMPLRAVTVTSNGSYIITAGDDKSVKAWNTATAKDDRTFLGAEGPVYAVAVSKNVQLLAAAGADKTIRLYGVNDGKLLGAFTAPATVRGLAFHPSLPILCSASDDQAVIAWNIAYQPGQALPPEFGKPIQSFAHAGAATAVAFSEQKSLFSAGADRMVKQWRIASDAPVKNFQLPNLADGVAYDPTGKLLATGCHDGRVRIYDIEKGSTLKSIDAHVQPDRAYPIYSIAWSNDGKQLLTASDDMSLKIWDSASGTLVRELKAFKDKDAPKGNRDQVFCGIFSKDGKVIASGAHDGAIKLWNAADGSVMREFANPALKQPPSSESPLAHPGGVYGLRFSPDGKYLTSVGTAPKLRGYLAVWNVADGKMIYGREQTTGPIYSVDISKDGKLLLLGCGSRDRLMPASEAIIVATPAP
jgi:WD40 repeat protein